MKLDLRVVLAALAGVWIASFLLGATPFDYTLTHAMNVGQTPVLARSVELLTHLGGWQVLTIVTLVFALSLTIRRRLGEAAVFLVLTLGCRILVHLQKLGFSQDRPPEWLRLIDVDSYAFPSGHAANAMATYLGAALLLLGPGRGRRIAVVAAIATALLIGLSRVMLGVHWATDVVAGWSFGLFTALVAFQFASNRAPSQARYR